MIEAEATAPPTVLISPPPATRAERFALRVIQLGAILVVIAAVTWREYELDRFFVPKELVLHATALLASAALLRSLRRIAFTRVDLLLIVFLALGALSSIFAQNGWLAVRALTLSASAVALFWCSRVLAAAGLGRYLLHAIALAGAIGAASALLQTYGVETDIFSVNRAPGGTLGNRNFIAHMAAFTLPAMLLVVLRTAATVRFAAAGVGATLLAATLVLTRSRAGFLALAAVIATFAAALVFAPALRRSMRTWVRLVTLIIIAAAGVTAAVLTPNALRWRGDNPYMESIAGVANYQEGSGRGRLVQYRQSARMAAAHPLLGVGPGNWGVRYPDYAAGDDPSLDRGQPGTTSNPWPSSDWVAFVSERGLVATIALALALIAMLLTGLRALRAAPELEDAAAGAALVATIAAAAIAGLFDAVLLLGLPALLVWTAVGALWQSQLDADAAAMAPPRPLFTAAAAAALFLALVGTARSAAQLASMGIHENATSLGWLQRGALIDPGNFRLQVRLARPGSGLRRAERCAHAVAARDLYPEAREARNLARGCE